MDKEKEDLREVRDIEDAEEAAEESESGIHVGEKIKKLREEKECPSRKWRKIRIFVRPALPD